MTIHTLPALKDNFIYILERDSVCAVIDPGEADPVIEYLEKCEFSLRAIWLTHHHHDHVGGVKDLMKWRSENSGAGAGEKPLEIWSSKYDQSRIPGVTHPVDGRGSYRWLGEPVHVLDVPGHTLGQIAFYLPESLALFPGDTLFSGGCGRLFEGSPEQMFNSLQKIKELPAETRVFFGHEYTLKNLEFIRHGIEMGIGGNSIQVSGSQIRPQNKSQSTSKSKDVGAHSLFISKNSTASSPFLLENLSTYEKICQEKVERGEFTSPTTLEQELKINPFLFSKSVAEFTAWREARNSW